jgi:hypothetical protein
MARSLSPEQQAAYEREKAFALYLATVLDEVSRHQPPGQIGERGPDGSVVYRDAPAYVLNIAAGLAASLERAEQRSPAEARAGLRMARNDLLEMSRPFAPTLVQAVDADLTNRGLPTLTATRASTWRTIPKVLARGRVRTEAEYYVVIERVNDMSNTDGLSADERARLGELAAQFEGRKARPRRGTA